MAKGEFDRDENGRLIATTESGHWDMVEYHTYRSEKREFNGNVKKSLLKAIVKSNFTTDEEKYGAQNEYDYCY